MKKKVKKSKKPKNKQKSISESPSNAKKAKNRSIANHIDEEHPLRHDDIESFKSKRKDTDILEVSP